MKKILFSIVMLAHVLMSSAQQERVVKSLDRPLVAKHWVGTWATAQQTPVRKFMPYNNDMSDRSVRQVVKVSVGGDVVRLQLSNIFSDEPVVIHSVYIAHALDSFRIDERSARYLRFNDRARVVIPAHQSVFSDAEEFDLHPLELVAITVNYTSAPKVPTVHMGSRTTSYILKGASTPETDFSKAFRYEKWFNIAALDVRQGSSKAIAILGNSITDGKGATTDKQDRWPDVMSEHLHRAGYHVGVLNLGIGNNRVLSMGFGQPAKDRFDRDILEQRGVGDVIVFEGINDLGSSADAKSTARQLIEQYKIMIAKARRQHLRVYGATITPMKGARYFTPNHEKGRQMVNDWIRHSKAFDGVIDFDELMRSPDDPEMMREEWQSDRLHPNARGYEEMGKFAAEFMQSHLK